MSRKYPRFRRRKPRAAGALRERVRELRRELLRVTGIAGDDEAGVVAGERADHARVLDAVERTRDRGRRAELRLDDDDVLRGRGAPAELSQDGGQRLLRVLAAAPALRWQVVTRAAESVVRLLEAELADVARDGRLRHRAAGGGERGEELVLRPDPLARDDAADQTLSLGFREHARALHSPSIVIRPTRQVGGGRPTDARPRAARRAGSASPPRSPRRSAARRSAALRAPRRARRPPAGP